MNKIKISIFTLTLSLIAFSCGESVDNSNHSDIAIEASIEEQNVAKNVNAEEFKTLIDKGGFLIDVRTSGEVLNGSIEGNTNVDFNGSNFKLEIEKLDKNVPVLVYCASGGRSGRAMSIMHDMGFSEVYNLNGGYNGWPNK